MTGSRLLRAGRPAKVAASIRIKEGGAMAGRWSAGPVFAFEWLTRSRRWQVYALRSLFVAALLLGLWGVWQSSVARGNLSSANQMAMAGRSFFETLTTLQLWLVLLAAPAATAGAICLDRARGSLTHVMVTDLSDAEVVLGKLAARLVPVLNLAACALPVAALGALLGGIDPVALTASFGIAAGLAVLGCSLALLLSVWVAKTHEVMTVVFAVWAAWLLVLPIFEMTSATGRGPTWLEVINPFWLTMARYEHPGETSLLEPALFALGCLLISAGLAAVAVARLRPACLHRADGGPRAARVPGLIATARRQVRWLRGPSLDANPVLWREWHRARPSRWTRAVWTTYAVTGSIASLWLIWAIRTVPARVDEELPGLVVGIMGAFGLLLVSASAATVLAEERVRGSLDVLLSTPIRTRSILRGKWWGAFRPVPWLAFWPTCIMLALLPEKATLWDVGLAYAVPILILGQGAAVASLGLALATWISRLGRAVTWTVTLFVGSVIGWVILGEMLPTEVTANGPRQEPVAPIVVACGSPFLNLFIPASMVGEQSSTHAREWRGITIGVTSWAIAYPLIAALLYLATRLTFDRCLGRSPEGPRRPRLRRRLRDLAVRGWGWRTPGAGGRRAVGAANSGPRPR